MRNESCPFFEGCLASLSSIFSVISSSQCSYPEFSNTPQNFFILHQFKGGHFSTKGHFSGHPVHTAFKRRLSILSQIFNGESTNRHFQQGDGPSGGLLWATAAQRFVDSSSVDQMTHPQIMDILFINIIYYPVTVSYMTVYG